MTTCPYPYQGLEARVRLASLEHQGRPFHAHAGYPGQPHCHPIDAQDGKEHRRLPTPADAFLVKRQ